MWTSTAFARACALGAALMMLPSAATAAGSVKPDRLASLSPCDLPGLDQPARCGVFDVPENPEQPHGRRLKISVAVIPALDGQGREDPIVPLMGGPGEDAISAAAIFADQFAALRRDRDILLVDQRGTGRSEALRCELYSSKDQATSLRDLFPVAAVQRCERQLSARADLTQYTYVHFSNDLEHIRRALGYGPLNLSAGSYGTRAAQVFLRIYPQSVRTVHLGSMIPIDIPTPLTMAKTAHLTLENTLDACANDAACGAAFPNLRDEFREIVARLDSGQLRVSLPNQKEPASVHRGRVVEWLRARLYRPKDAVTVPWLIHQAYTGNWSPIVEGVLANAREADAALSFGLFFSITCNEDIAFVREEDIVRETKETFLSDYRVRQQQAACREWPKVTLPADYRSPVRSSAPTLFVSGDSDGGSPLWFTDHAAPGFSNRAEIVLRGRGHTEWTECVGRLYDQFVRSGAAQGIKSASCEPTPRPAFRTR